MNYQRHKSEESVEDYLETSEEDEKDEHFLSTYVFLLRIVVTVLLFYMIVRCFLG